MVKHGIKYVPSWVEQEGYIDRVAINEAFIDNGVYCELVEWDEETKYWKFVRDVSMHCRRYGHVNYACKGTYILEYKFENYPVGDGGTTPKFIKNLDNGNGEDNFIDAVKRVVEVYEPNWLEQITPSHYQWFPIVKQSIERYSDLYWELSYRADWTRMGMDGRKIPCERYLSDFAVPAGEVVDIMDGDWIKISGYTFKVGQTVTLAEKHTNYSEAIRNGEEYVVSQVRDTGEYWSEDGNGSGGYGKGDYVRYLDKEYICNVGHEINANKFSMTSAVIPGAGDVNEEGEPYWVTACMIRLLKYKYGDYRRGFDNSIQGINKTDRIFETRPFVDAQGFIFQYNYGAIGELDLDPDIEFELTEEVCIPRKRVKVRLHVSSNSVCIRKPNLSITASADKGEVCIPVPVLRAVLHSSRSRVCVPNPG